MTRRRALQRHTNDLAKIPALWLGRFMIGILMLDTAFPRVVGDVGNPKSFDYDVRYAVVPGATPKAIVRGDVAPWVQAFIVAGRTLVSEGCTGLATTCGFLTPLRAEVERSTGVPVVSSSLELIPKLLADGAQPGILTISAASLEENHLQAAGVPYQTPIQGVDGGHFSTSILENRTKLDTALAESEMVSGAEVLCKMHPRIDTIVLECTNMPPYAEAIKSATGCDVVSVLTLIDTLQRTCKKQ